METNKMETRDIFPLLMSMSLPMVLSMLVQSLYNIIDSIYVSYLGTGALTAVSLAFPLQNIVLSVAVGIGVGIASVLSISLGKKDQKRANEAATMGMALTLIDRTAVELHRTREVAVGKLPFRVFYPCSRTICHRCKESA